jgi:hypothetical protein
MVAMSMPMATPVRTPSLPKGVKGAVVAFVKSDNKITFRGASFTDRISFQLYNYLGKLMCSGTSIPGDFSLNTAQFSSGVYVLWYRVNADKYYLSTILQR